MEGGHLRFLLLTSFNRWTSKIKKDIHFSRFLLDTTVQPLGSNEAVERNPSPRTPFVGLSPHFLKGNHQLSATEGKSNLGIRKDLIGRTSEVVRRQCDPIVSQVFTVNL